MLGPPPSPPTPPQTQCLTAPSCRLSCSPIGCRPSPSDQSELLESELRGEAQQRQAPARCCTQHCCSHFCSTVPQHYHTALNFSTLCKKVSVSWEKESHSCCKLRVVWASCWEPAGYRPEGQKEPSPGFHAHRWNQALVSMCTNRTRPGLPAHRKNKALVPMMITHR